MQNEGWSQPLWGSCRTPCHIAPYLGGVFREGHLEPEDTGAVNEHVERSEASGDLRLQPLYSVMVREIRGEVMCRPGPLRLASAERSVSSSLPWRMTVPP
jgi:hypothetical protein